MEGQYNTVPGAQTLPDIVSHTPIQDAVVRRMTERQLIQYT